MAERALPVSALTPSNINPVLNDHTLALRFDLGEVDSRITFTRASTRTRQGPLGLIESVAANLPAIEYNPATKHDSVTALVVGLGSKLFAVTGGSGFTVGTAVRLTSKADPSKWMAGLVVSFAAGSLRVNVLRSGGSGSASDWTVIACRGLLIEEARTNLLTYSEQFDNAAWSKAAGTHVLPNSGIAPDGTMTADVVTAAANANSPARSLSGTTVAGTTYTYSVWLRSAAPVSMTLQIPTPDYGGYLAQKAVNVTSVWQRFDVTFTGQAGSAWHRVPAGGAVYEIWGAQLEVGAFPTSYIPTPASFTSRASTATYFDANGVMQSAAINVARNGFGLVNGQRVSKGLELEAAAANLLTYSEQFDNAAWTKTDASFSTNVVVAPDGTLTADKLIAAANTNLHYVRRDFAGADNTDYAASVFAKAGEWDTASLEYISQAGGIKAFTINLSTGVISAGRAGATLPAAYGADYVGSGWYRLWLRDNNVTGATVERVEVFAGNGGSLTALGDGVSGLYLWGAQLETGSLATSYIPTLATFTSRASTATYFNSTGVLTTAAINEARNGYGLVNGVWVSKGLELEAAATNLLTYSEQFDNAAWTKSLLVTPNSASAPDGSLTADTLTVAGAVQSIYRNDTVAAGTAYTLSWFVKLGTMVAADYKIALYNNSAGSFIAQDVVPAMQPNATGWTRITYTITTPAGCTSLRVYPFRNNATVNGTVHVWGAQLETGSLATSYIPTVASTVTRAADVSSSATVTRAADISSSATVTRAQDLAAMTGANFSSWYNQGEGTFVMHTLHPVLYTSASAMLLSANNGTTAERLSMYRNGTSQALGIIRVDDGVSESAPNTANAFQAGVLARGAYAYKLNDFGVCLNGGTVGLDASGTLPTPVQLQIGNQLGSTPLNGHLSRISYFSKRLTNAQLQVLSS